MNYNNNNNILIITHVYTNFLKDFILMEIISSTKAMK